MANYYSAQYKPKHNPSGLSGHIGSNIRYHYIVTDTLHNAYQLARAQCLSHEELIGVSELEEDVLVDPGCVTGDSA